MDIQSIEQYFDGEAANIVGKQKAFLFGSIKYRLLQNNQTIKFYEILFERKEQEKLVALLKEGRVEDVAALKRTHIDSLKLRIAATADGSFCCSQVVVFVPYEFINYTEVRLHTPSEAQTLLKAVK
ncbi:MAG: hypothetical protein LBT35_03270 [Tannerella sp.]|jgi:hypothetical protein|nr:hypothetical protein [Tannerella sp.]